MYLLMQMWWINAEMNEHHPFNTLLKSFDLQPSVTWFGRTERKKKDIPEIIIK